KIDGILVGNEVILRNDIPIQNLSDRILDVKSKINSMGFNKTMPVSTSDIFSNNNITFINAVDAVWDNIHPYWYAVNITESASWVFNTYNESVVPLAENASKDSVISEVGWPTDGNAQGPSVPSVQNLQIFLDTFICSANLKGIKYYYFEAFDIPWKKAIGLVEGSWGLFYPDRTMKPIILPDCVV
ncbi:9405_t:CDS:2, partial [Racocetra persica]